MRAKLINNIKLVKNFKDSEKFIDSEFDYTNETDEMILDSVKGTNIFVIYNNDIVCGVIDYKIRTKDIIINWIYIGYKFRGFSISKQVFNFLKTKYQLPIILHPFTNDAEEAFIKQGFVIDPEYDHNDPNTLVLY